MDSPDNSDIEIVKLNTSVNIARNAARG